MVFCIRKKLLNNGMFLQHQRTSELKIAWAGFGMYLKNYYRGQKMKKINKVMNDMITFILGDKRGSERRVKKSKRKKTRRVSQRRK